MSTAQNPIFTIGHSTHSSEAFLDLLQSHGITRLAELEHLPTQAASRAAELLLHR